MVLPISYRVAMAAFIDSFGDYESKSPELTINVNDQIGRSDSMSFEYDGGIFKIENAGTTAELIVAYIKQFNKKPKIHTGILFSGNKFASYNEKHDFALFHRMPASFRMKSSNDRGKLIEELFVYGKTSNVATVPFGKIMTPVNDLVNEINQTLKQSFVIQNNTYERWEQC